MGLNCPWCGGTGMMGGNWLATLFFGLLLLGLLVLVVLAVVFAASRSRSGTTATPTIREGAALRAAGERYARGEITREEYLRIRDDLEGRTPSGGPG